MADIDHAAILRQHADTRRRGHSVNPDVLRAAADEIESLRAELRRASAAAEEPENLNMQVDALRRRVRELTDRNARLQSQIQESEVREI